MPARKGMTKRKPLSDGIRYGFITGDFDTHRDADTFAYYFMMSSDEQRAVWMQRRDVILSAFIRDCPGRRPWGWWHFEAPEPRRRVGGPAEIVPAWECYNVRPRYWFGVPRDHYDVRIKSDRLYDKVSFDEVEQYYESQHDYLERLGLLTEAER